MKASDHQRLYQVLARTLKQRINDGIYPVGTKLPAERFICEEMAVSRTVVREAIIMLEVEGLVEVRKGSGIHVLARTVADQPDDQDAQLTAGPFELLQSRQLLESHIAEFAATQVTKQDIIALMEIQRQARYEDRSRDSVWDKAFHIQVAKATQNAVLVTVVESLWQLRENNPYWRKLHEHIDAGAIKSWCDDHDQILKALIRKDPQAAKLAMWQHLENTKEMLFQAMSTGDELHNDSFLFADNPVLQLSGK
jgi:GntR family hexuronate regulon transcriptional repressor